ncbi:MAG: branched-chain amino acid ABC transporter permease [Burkholderiaceae bacterium]
MREGRRALALSVLAAAVLAAPWALGGGADVFGAMVLIAIFAVMAYGLDVIVSDLGEVSLAHPVFFAAGCYTTALLGTRAGAGGWVTLAGSIAVSLAFAALIGSVTLRLREFVFSLVTYAVGVVALTVVSNWDFLGGSDGLRGIPPLDLSIGGWSFVAANDRELWPVAFTMLVIVVYLIDRLRHSRLGAAAMMTHLNPKLATIGGVDPARVRLLVFLFSAPISAVAGWLYAYQRAFVGADVLESYFLILMLTAVVLVGRRQLLGPLLATALILAQEKFLSMGGNLDKIVLGGALVVVLGFFPRGLSGLWRRRARRVGGSPGAGPPR